MKAPFYMPDEATLKSYGYEPTGPNSFAQADGLHSITLRPRLKRIEFYFRRSTGHKWLENGYMAKLTDESKFHRFMS